MSGLQGAAPGAVTGGVARRRGRRLRTFGFWLMVVVLLLAAVGAAGGGAAGIVAAARRHPSHAQITAAGQREQAVLWERLSAGQVFPSSVSYTNVLGEQTRATLVGIAPQASCRSSVDGGAAADLAAAGCVTMLRATYADASGTALATVGIAVLRSAAAAAKARDALRAGADGGLLALAFPGTVASAFTGKARETYATHGVRGRYLFLYAAGYADGRATTLQTRADAIYHGEWVTPDLGVAVTNSLASKFAAPADPCKDKNIRC